MTAGPRFVTYLTHSLTRTCSWKRTFALRTETPCDPHRKLAFYDPDRGRSKPDKGPDSIRNGRYRGKQHGDRPEQAHREAGQGGGPRIRPEKQGGRYGGGVGAQRHAAGDVVICPKRSNDISLESPQGRKEGLQTYPPGS